ncbi:hypothetical protein FQN50_001398 [Emmonsiellopsis sp. PD_5]|nr:hypothetical protein FQN50_001398 [Emmonsiellopsis sp. PD_5]
MDAKDCIIQFEGDVERRDISKRGHIDQQIPRERSYRTVMIFIFALLAALLFAFARSPYLPTIKRTLQQDGNQLRCFQVHKPITNVPDEEKRDGCNLEILLMRHEFGFSYGHPFVGNYVPPPCDFDTVIMNLTVTSKGRQFDRLALMFLGDTEVFRTSTAEPTANGIIWTYIKDISMYKALWAEPQKLIFDLGNLINDIYTGPFDVTLTATFSLGFNGVRTADVILPISAQRSAAGSPSAFSLPKDNATVAHIIPDTTSRAIVSISACGQSTEEFWFSNVLSSDINTFNETTGPLYGYSPFREVQLFIDDQLAGVVWPFPIIFTGGIAPGFWRPMVGIDAFDLREPEIDISPFLPVLTDGRAHSFRINVVGLGDPKDDGTAEVSNQVGSYWVVTGKVFVYLDKEPTVGSAGILDRRISPTISTDFSSNILHEWVQSPETGANETLSYSIRVSRSLTVSSRSSEWSQKLTFSNAGSLSGQGVAQVNEQHTYSTSTASALNDDGERITVSETTSYYPLDVFSEYNNTSSGGLEIEASLSRGLHYTFYSDDIDIYSPYTLTSGPLKFDATQAGEATYVSAANRSFSTGDTTEYFEEDSRGALFTTRVRTVNGSVVGGDGTLPAFNPLETQEVALGRDSVRAILGRGPGDSRP